MLIIVIYNEWKINSTDEIEYDFFEDMRYRSQISLETFYVFKISILGNKKWF